jgi:hypothetical protein
LEAESKFGSALQLEAIARAVPARDILAVLEAQGQQERRERKRNAYVTVLLVIAMNIYTHASIWDVMGKIARGWRYIWPDDGYKVANDAAISYRRYQLGARPMAALFHHVCRPLAVPETPGNAATFGRHRGPRGVAAFL